MTTSAGFVQSLQQRQANNLSILLSQMTPFDTEILPIAIVFD